MLAGLVPQIAEGGDLRSLAAELVCLHVTESLVFTIAAALLFVALAGQRRGAAGTGADLDTETGALTRAAFFIKGRAFLDATRSEERA